MCGIRKVGRKILKTYFLQLLCASLRGRGACQGEKRKSVSVANLVPEELDLVPENISGSWFGSWLVLVPGLVPESKSSP